MITVFNILVKTTPSWIRPVPVTTFCSGAAKDKSLTNTNGKISLLYHLYDTFNYDTKYVTQFYPIVPTHVHLAYEFKNVCRFSE